MVVAEIRPAVVTLTAPPAVPAAPEVFNAPVKFVKPFPVVCVKLAACTPAVVTLRAALIVMAPSAVALPTAPLNNTSPAVPAVIPRDCPPFNVLLNVTVPPPAPAPVERRTLPVNVTPLKKLMSSCVVVISPAVETSPAPFCVKEPSRFISPAAAMVNNPAFVTCTIPLDVVMTPALKVKALPVRDIPVAVLVFKAVLNIVVPVPAD